MSTLAKSVPCLGLIVAGLLASGCVAQTTDTPPDKCPAKGTATGRAAQALNILKNRATEPTKAQINPQVTLDSMLADGPDRNRFDQKQGAEIVGYVIKVEQGGHPETANCGNMGTYLTDTHITVATGPGASDVQTLVVEVTPTWRVAMQKLGVDWRTETLQTTLVGHRVKFRGWLLFDTGHVREAINTAPQGTKDVSVLLRPSGGARRWVGFCVFVVDDKRPLKNKRTLIDATEGRRAGAGAVR